MNEGSNRRGSTGEDTTQTSLINAEEFAKLIVPRRRGSSSSKVYNGLATVEAVHGSKVSLVLDGDTRPSEKLRRYLTSYKPKHGDRVLLVNDIIVGSIKY